MTDRKLDGSELYVVAHLMNGMEVIAIMDGEDSNYVKLFHPMEIRMLPETRADGKKVWSKFAAMPLTQLSEDPNFIIAKQHILFIKKLSREMKEHYRSLIVKPSQFAELEHEHWDDLEREEEDEIKTVDDLDNFIKKTYH